MTTNDIVNADDYLGELMDEYYTRLEKIKGGHYAMEATITKWCYACQWWNSLKPYRQVDDVWNRKALREIFWKEAA
jgi:hypothetical protein